jgi:hypothetical protein
VTSVTSVGDKDDAVTGEVPATDVGGAGGPSHLAHRGHLRGCGAARPACLPRVAVAARATPPRGGAARCQTTARRPTASSQQAARALPG